MKDIHRIDAIYPKEELISRSAKRLYAQESTKVIEDFEEINTQFLTLLFDDENRWVLTGEPEHLPHFSYTYIELYNYHLESWISIYTWYKKFGRLQYCVIDEDWFANNYKPKENLNNKY